MGLDGTLRGTFSRTIVAILLGTSLTLIPFEPQQLLVVSKEPLDDWMCAFLLAMMWTQALASLTVLTTAVMTGFVALAEQAWRWHSKLWHRPVTLHCDDLYVAAPGDCPICLHPLAEDDDEGLLRQLASTPSMQFASETGLTSEIMPRMQASDALHQGVCPPDAPDEHSTNRRCAAVYFQYLTHRVTVRSALVSVREGRCVSAAIMNKACVSF
eukprot:CAMPEP_0172716954 /NCGR_PEP_ID=MMETSP1074-20121228/69882_1 /TAXON_ID=2916 /ORGANISM="Ceratium fusus, Strain PA161109" /LENGTH=212 /DNA_ID=CAMNT_0013541771 /DNA_START=313 /DNA_END=953 /DNA_ORIENTATION=+